MTLREERESMVDQHLAARGISDARVLAAFRAVPREEFISAEFAAFAYRDTPLSIGQGQTISQPYIVAVTLEALGLQGGERVLEIGTGSGYAAALMAQLAKEVYTVERLQDLAVAARHRFERLDYPTVHVRWGDGTLGWSEHAPYDAIAVAAGGPRIPQALLQQLAPGGRLVMPVGPDDESQVLVRVVREGDEYRQTTIADVRFVPLIGAQGWAEEPPTTPLVPVPSKRKSSSAGGLSALVRESCQRITSLDDVPLDALIERIGDARVVLLGESTHGTSEFYRMRARISQALIERAGFNFIAAEADWPDAASVGRYVVGNVAPQPVAFTPFARFPTWMWRNAEVRDSVDWLRTHNLRMHDSSRRVGFHGLDIYSLFTSIAVVLAYLNDVDDGAAKTAKARYSLLTPWHKDPAAYGRAVFTGRYESSERAVVAILKEMLVQRLAYSQKDGARFFDAAQNARVVANAERYYRAMYHGSVASWNLRDTHMFDTLQSLLAYYGPDSRGIVWAHNSHVGNAMATEMGMRGELNIGQLCRNEFGQDAYLIGFGTDHGTVAAASNWDEPMQVMRVRPAHAESYERIFHDAGIPAFLLHLRDPHRAAIRDELMSPRLERAIGVVYRPDTELQSHYFDASLPQQFDEYVWFDQSHAVTPLESADLVPVLAST